LHYVILIHRKPDFWTALDKEEAATLRTAYQAYVQSAHEAGVLVAGDQLEDAKKAKIVSAGNGGTRIADGPYAQEEKELGGYFVIETASEPEAIGWAARCPGAKYGTGVELRPTVAQRMEH